MARPVSLSKIVGGGVPVIQLLWEAEHETLNLGGEAAVARSCHRHSSLGDEKDPILKKKKEWVKEKTIVIVNLAQCLY